MLQKSTNSRQGIVFLNTLSRKDAVRFIYRFGDGPFYSTAAVKSSDWTLGPTIPFATKNFSVIVVDDATSKVISEQFVPFPYFNVVILQDTPQVEIQILPLGDPFESFLFFFNFNRESSPYRYLWINGNSPGNVTVNPSQPTLLLYSQNRNATKGFTSVYYELCDSFNNTDNCQRYLSPYLGALKQAESVWVVFTPIRQFQIPVYSPMPIVKPSLLNSHYNISSNAGYAGASQAVFETIHQTFSPRDLRKFQRENKLPFTKLSNDYFGGVETGHFCSKHVGSCAEANLDMQIITSLSQTPTNTSLFYERDFSNLGFTVAWILYIADLHKPPLVISLSYGADERSLRPLLIELFDIEAVKVVIFILIALLNDASPRLDLRVSPLLYPAGMME